jgi:hypothetical protein
MRRRAREAKRVASPRLRKLLTYSQVMARIRLKNSLLEVRTRSMVRDLGPSFCIRVNDLPRASRTW